MKYNSRKFVFLAVIIVIAVCVAIYLLKVTKHSPKLETSRENDTSPAQLPIRKSNSSESAKLDHAQELIRSLRDAATKISDPQALFFANASILEQLRLLGADAIPACLVEITDKTSPLSLRILLIEFAAGLNGHKDTRLGQTLMVIIGDATDSKAVRMQALQWIPQTGDESAGATILQLLPNQTDPNLEFGITRAMRGFKVPGSVDILKPELADEKSYLIRIAALHAVAAQGGQEALTVLQNAVASKLAVGSDESHVEENAVGVHAVLALGEIPDASSVSVLSSILTNPADSVSVRNAAAKAIASIGGTAATQALRGALQNTSDESVLVYIARGLGLCGDASDANACLARAAIVSDSYTKSELERASHALQARIRQ